MWSKANISRVMTNERSFSVVNASAPVGTTDKLNDFLSYLPGVPPVSCRASKDACHHFTICSLKLHSWFALNRIFFNILSFCEKQHLISYIIDNNIDFYYVPHLLIDIYIRERGIKHFKLLPHFHIMILHIFYFRGWFSNIYYIRKSSPIIFIKDYNYIIHFSTLFPNIYIY